MGEKSQRKHPLQHFLAGGIAGFVESSICHPLDTIKTRMQLRRQHAQPIGHSLRNVNPLNRSLGGLTPLNRTSLAEPEPAKVAKLVAVAHSTHAGVTRPHSLGPIGTARRIIEREGVLALYKGLTAVWTGESQS